MTKSIFVLPALGLLFLTALWLTACSHGTPPASPVSGQSAGSTVQVTAAPPAPFNPTVTPPAPPQSVPAYVFNNQPAPIPAPTPIIEHHRHRYLHIVLRDHRCYLEDHYGNYYRTGRDDDGDVYPIYQDPNTGADYPLYYDEDRDEYYRCVNDGDGGYYRNYIGDPDNEFYQGDPDQQEECQSENSQPFVVNYDDTYDSGEGYDPNYADYSGPRYSRHNHDLVEILPVIVAAYILLEPSDNGGGGGDRGGNGNWNGGRQTVQVNNHNYYRSTVIVNSPNSAGGHYAAQPGPPIGHFAGYKASGHGRLRAADSVPIARATAVPHTAYAPTQAKSSDTTVGNSSHFRGARQNGRQVMAAGATAQPYKHSDDSRRVNLETSNPKRTDSPNLTTNRNTQGLQRGSLNSRTTGNTNFGLGRHPGARSISAPASAHSSLASRTRKETAPARIAAHSEAGSPAKREPTSTRQYQAQAQHRTQSAIDAAPPVPSARHYSAPSRPAEQLQPAYHGPQQQRQFQAPRREQQLIQTPRQQQQDQVPRQQQPFQQPRRQQLQPSHQQQFQAPRPQQFQAPRQQQQLQAPRPQQFRAPRQSAPAPRAQAAPQQPSAQQSAPRGGGGLSGGGLPGRKH